MCTYVHIIFYCNYGVHLSVCQHLFRSVHLYFSALETLKVLKVHKVLVVLKCTREHTGTQGCSQFSAL